MDIREFGWSQYKRHNKESPTEQSVGRIGVEHKTSFIIHSHEGDLEGIILGKFRKVAKSPSDFPKVGDWIEYTKLPSESKAVIDKVLPRYSVLARKAAGDTGKEQIIATNVDKLFIIFGLDQELNPALIERYLSMAYEGGVKPILIFNKTDKAKLISKVLKQAQAIDPQLQIYAISAKTTIGLHQIESIIEPAKTIAFVGPSGAGKSTLINALLGHNVQTTGDVRITDAKGRHTTTRREMFILASGGILIDTPGIRELETLSATETLKSVFADCEQLSRNCRYRNCDHIHSRGCAVLQAVETGELSQERYASFIKQLVIGTESGDRNKKTNVRTRAERTAARFTGKARKL